MNMECNKDDIVMAVCNQDCGNNANVFETVRILSQSRAVLENAS